MSKTPDFVTQNKNIIDNALLAHFEKLGLDKNIVINAMNYSTSLGGKRIRPCLVIEFCKACGGDVNSALPFAKAIEMIHTYSLIHDDLPCMDDDDFRRGKPSCHIKYGYANALLAGDALLTMAFECITESEDISDKSKVEAVRILSQYAGISGMIGGQVLDLDFENRNADSNEILDMYKLKTGCLLALSAKLGCIAANGDEAHKKAAEEYAFNLGYAFQIVDDILDVIGDKKTLGKPIGSDAQRGKNTYLSKVGMETAKEDIEKYTNKAIAALESFKDREKLKELAGYLLSRKY